MSANSRKAYAARVQRRRQEEHRRMIRERFLNGLACASLVVVSEAVLFAFLLM